MAQYTSEVKTDKNYIGNAVIRIAGRYFAIRQPDSGLFIPTPHCNALSSLVLNPTAINPKNVTTTISSTSFKLLDKTGIVARLVKDRAAGIISSDVDIWLGRSGTGMDFSEYYQLPTARISKVSKPGNGNYYTFATRDSTDRMNRPLYDRLTRLQGDILAGTTTIIAKDDISSFPASGTFQLDNELVTYTSKTDGTKTFNGCSRGAFGTIPAAHDDNVNMYQADTLSSENPIDILLQILTSNGGGGAYDLLSDGLGIDASLIDITGIEALRDAKFASDTFSLALYNISNALKYLEDQILAPCKLRFTFSNDSKLTLALLDSALFVESIDVIDHDTLVESPSVDISDVEIVNKITVNWDFDEGTQKFLEKTVYEDASSIATYGPCTSPLQFSFKGVESQAFADDFALRLLERLAIPSPVFTAKTQIDKSLLNVGEQTQLITSHLPNENGLMHFASDLEIVSRAINWETGDVTFKLQYTSYSGQRLGYIAPSDLIDSIAAQDEVDFAAGRGDYWEVGWKVRLFDTTIGEYTADAVNEIAAISGDTITFVDPWTTVLGLQHQIKFADYDNATDAQRRYAFVSINNQDFAPGEKQYTIAP